MWPVPNFTPKISLSWIVSGEAFIGFCVEMKGKSNIYYFDKETLFLYQKV